MNIQNISFPSNTALPGNISSVPGGRNSFESGEIPADEFIPRNSGKLELRTEVERIISSSETASAPIETRQFPDSRGRVKHMAIMLGPMYSGSVRNQLLNAYKTMFEHMEPDTKFTVVCGSPGDQEDIEKVINDNNIPNPERIKFVDAGTGVTIWARDMLVSSYDVNSGKSVMINSAHIHSRDGNVPPLIAMNDSSVGVINSPILVTDGGDTVSTTQDSFVGYDSIKRTSNRIQWLASDHPDFKEWAVGYYENVMGKEAPGPKKVKDEDLNFFQKMMHKYTGKTYYVTQEGKMYEDLAVKLFEEYFGKQVTPVGKDDPSTKEVEQPVVFHQDMCMTPVDDKTFFLGDPTLFENLVNSLSPEDLAKADEQFKEISNLGFLNRGLKKFVKETRNSNNLADVAAYEKTLKEKGYDVIRLPYRYTHSATKPSFTYNNCLMERFEKDGKEVRRVFLPVLGVETIDNYAIQTYKDQGFEVFPIQMNDVIKMQGALRCVTNWLERSDKA